jgi:hypothetical protein
MVKKNLDADSSLKNKNISTNKTIKKKSFTNDVYYATYKQKTDEYFSSLIDMQSYLDGLE